MPSSDVPSLTKTLNLIETITKIQIKDRTKELKKIYAKCEDLYLVCELTNTKHLLGFLSYQVLKFGIVSLQNSVSILERKVNRSLSLIDDLSKLGLESPTELAPMLIQVRYAKLERLWEECQNEESRKDSIHPDIIARIDNVKKSLDEYMSKYAISKIDPVDKKYQKIWASTKTSLDIKSKDLKFNHYVSSAQRMESLPLAKAELERAYKMIQEHPSHFALEKQKNLINMIADIDNQLENVEQESSSFLDGTYKLLREFQFKKVRQKLDDYKLDLEKKGFSDHDLQIKEQLEKCTANELLFESLLEVEKIFEQNDLLGSRAAILSLMENMKEIEEVDLLIDTLKTRIDVLHSDISGNQTTGNVPSQPFDPFGDLDPIPSESENQPKKTPSASKKKSKQSPKSVSKKKKTTTSADQNKKEKDALDALDDLLS